MEATTEKSTDTGYLITSRDFLCDLLTQEIEVLDNWKARPESYSRDIPAELSKYDLTNDDLMSLAYGISRPAVLSEKLIHSMDDVTSNNEKLSRVKKLFQSGIDEYLNMLMENTKYAKEPRKFKLNRAQLAAFREEAQAEHALKEARDAQLNASSCTPGSGGSTKKALSWKTFNRQDADDKLYGNTHHAVGAMADRRVTGSAASGHAGTNEENRKKLGPKPYWAVMTGCVDAELLVGSTAEKILAHHQKLVSLRKNTAFKVSKANTMKALAGGDAGDGRKGKGGGAGELDKSFVEGPVVSIPFKPPFWKQFDSTTQGQQKMDLLRKEALKQRHMSTYVASTAKSPAAMAMAPESPAPSVGGLPSAPGSEASAAFKNKSIEDKPKERPSLFGDPPITIMDVNAAPTPAEEEKETAALDTTTGSSKASRRAYTFADLIKSMAVFYHLTNEEIDKLESKCTPIAFVDGELVFTEGDLCASAYLMSAGTITVQQENPRQLGTKDLIGTLSRGDTFGDTSFFNTVAARTCKSSFIAIGDEVSAYSMTGDTYRKYAYKRNSAFVVPIDTTAKANSRNAAAAATQSDQVSTSKEEVSLTAHVESYLEFLLLFRSSGGLFDGSHDHIIPNTVKADEEPDDDAGRDMGDLESKSRDSGDGKSRARSSISSLLDNASIRNRRISVSHSKIMAKNFNDFQDKQANASELDGPVKEKDRVDHFASIFGKAEGDTDDEEEENEYTHAQHVADHGTVEQAILDKAQTVVENRRRLILAMMGAASPELELPETLEVLLGLIKDFFQVDRVGIFVIDKIKNAMTLYMSQFDKGAKKLDAPAVAAAAAAAAAAAGGDSDSNTSAVDGTDSPSKKEAEVKEKTIDSLYLQVPLKGIAGHIAKSGEIVVLPDCYDHPLFDSHMDEKTGYRTKQLLCVPCFDRSIDGSVVGVLQCINPYGVVQTAKGFKDAEIKKAGSVIGKHKAGSKKAGKMKNKMRRREGTPESTTHKRNSVLESDSDTDSDSETNGTEREKEALNAAQLAVQVAKNGGTSDFTKTDEMLAVMISSLIGTVIGSHKNRANIDVGNKNNTGISISTPSSFIRKPLGLRVNKLVFNIPDADSTDISVDINDPIQFPPSVKCTATVYNGINQVGEAKYTSKVLREMGVGAHHANRDQPDTSWMGGDETLNTSTKSVNKSSKSSKAKKVVPFEEKLDGIVVMWDVNQSLEFPEVWIRNLPLSSRVILQFYGPKGKPLGWCVINLFNFDKELITGRRVCQLWDGACLDPIQACSWPQRTHTNGARYAGESAGVDKYVQFEFKAFDRPVVFAPSLVNRNATEENDKLDILSLSDRLDRLTHDEYHRFMVVSGISRGYSSDVVRNLSAEDRALVWQMRRTMQHHWSLLPAFLLSVPWNTSEGVYEAYRLMSEWKVPTAKWHAGHHHHHGVFGGVNDNNSSHAMATRTVALHLLHGSAFPDPKIRAYAVITLLKGLSDKDLAAILLPLVGALKYERYGDNALVRFLLRRAIESPIDIGTPLYWHLKTQIDLLQLGLPGSDNPALLQRYAVLTQLYMRKSGDRIRASLGHSELVHRRIAHVCRRILDPSIVHKDEISKDSKSNFGFGTGSGIGTGNKRNDDPSDKWEQRRRALVKQLRDIELPSSFDFPGNTAYMVNTLELKDCVLQKTWPHRSIKLVFAVDEGEVVKKRFKKSMNKCVLWNKIDVDPSAENITLTMLRSFDSLWSAYGLDIKVTTYNVIHQRFNTESADPKVAKTMGSTLYEVPMHAQTFQEVLLEHAKWNGTEVKSKSGWAGGLFKAASGPVNGVSNFKDLGGILTSGPKEYVSLQNREFPGDVMENWYCMQNFELDPNGRIHSEKNLREPSAKIHATVYEKYFTKKKHARRGTLLGIPSLSTTVETPNTRENVTLYEPNPASFAWRLTYARSLAGWYVSTYVLHIINRTADNVMFLPTGQIFNFELNCLNLDERINKLKEGLTEKDEKRMPYSPRPPASNSQNENLANHVSRSAPTTINSGYATLESLHKDASAMLIEHSAPDDPEAIKVAKKRATKVTAAVAGSARQQGINTGNYCQNGTNGSGFGRTHVPLLPCFVRPLGPSNGSLFGYFREYCLNAFTVLRSHPEFLMQTLKSALLTVPEFGSSEVRESAIAPVVEALMANLMLEMEVDEEAARNRFISHMQLDMAFYSSTAGSDSYPAAKNFTDK